MFIRLNEDEVKQFKSEWTVINAPGFMADPEVDGNKTTQFCHLKFH